MPAPCPAGPPDPAVAAELAVPAMCSSVAVPYLSSLLWTHSSLNYEILTASQAAALTANISSLVLDHFLGF